MVLTYHLLQSIITTMLNIDGSGQLHSVPFANGFLFDSDGGCILPYNNLLRITKFVSVLLQVIIAGNYGSVSFSYVPLASLITINNIAYRNLDPKGYMITNACSR